MSEKLPEEKDGLLELFKKLWLPLAGFIGAVTLAYNFYKLWLGDQSTVTYFFAGGGLIVLVIALGWIGFSTRTIDRALNFPHGATYRETNLRFSLPHRRAAWVGLGVLTLLAVSGIILLIQYRQSQEKFLAVQEQKLIVVIAAFEGPEEVYGLRNEIIESLNAEFASDENIEIIPVDDVITLTQGSDYARRLGENLLADVVIWGWYRPTENPNITIHIENLSPEQLLPLQESETMQPVVILADLKSFSFQQQAGQETSALISFLSGYIDFRDEDYKSAIESFDRALANLSAEPWFFGEKQSEIHYYRGNANILLGDFQSAIQDFDQAIQINPQFEWAYNTRGIAYGFLGEYQRAIQDFDQAIQINPQYEWAYNNRGIAYSGLGNYQRAIQDLDHAIQINSKFAVGYSSRGFLYARLGNYQRAIQDFDQAIQINPQLADAYYNRGYVYSDLGDYQRAIQDYDQTIQINPQLAWAYNNRGLAYFNLGSYQPAIQDFDQAIQINPKFAEPYNMRGLAYYNLGDYQRAIQDFDQSIQINPQLADAYNNRGFAYFNLINTQPAIHDFDQAIQINPKFAEAYNNRGCVYGYLGEYQRAIQDFDQAIQIDPKLAVAYKNRGIAYQKLGKATEAEADFKKYEELTGQKP